MANRSLHGEFSHWFSQTWDKSYAKSSSLHFIRSIHTFSYLKSHYIYVHISIFLSRLAFFVINSTSVLLKFFSFRLHCDLHRPLQNFHPFGFSVCFPTILFIPCNLLLLWNAVILISSSSPCSWLNPSFLFLLLLGNIICIRLINQTDKSLQHCLSF